MTSNAQMHGLARTIASAAAEVSVELPPSTGR